MTASIAQQRIVALVAVTVLLLASLALIERLGRSPGRALGELPARLVADGPAARTVDAYRGLGAWVDVYDFAPTYQSGPTPPLTPEAVDEMAELGVRTIFIQAARNDERATDGVVDPGVLAQFLLRAHRNGIRVVGWYLPKFADVDLDLRRLAAVSDFEVLGHRFDGVAVDIEFTEDVPDHALRSQRLVTLSGRLRDRMGQEVLGAIVLPPVQLEVVNPRFWPAFPYRDLEALYDVWLPMAYWTFRRADSGYHDGYRYSHESVERLRANLGEPDARVHPIGGIGDEATTGELDAFLQSLADVDAVGGSIYDWATLSEENRRVMADGFGSGPAAELGPP